MHRAVFVVVVAVVAVVTFQSKLMLPLPKLKPEADDCCLYIRHYVSLSVLIVNSKWVGFYAPNSCNRISVS